MIGDGARRLVEGGMIRWHERCAEVLGSLGFKPSKADSDLWMRPTADNSAYEYIAVYVDDLAIAAKDPADIVKTLREKFGFKIKGDGVISHISPPWS